MQNSVNNLFLDGALMLSAIDNDARSAIMKTVVTSVPCKCTQWLKSVPMTADLQLWGSFKWVLKTIFQKTNGSC